MGILQGVVDVLTTGEIGEMNRRSLDDLHMALQAFPRESLGAPLGMGSLTHPTPGEIDRANMAEPSEPMPEPMPEPEPIEMPEPGE